LVEHRKTNQGKKKLVWFKNNKAGGDLSGSLGKGKRTKKKLNKPTQKGSERNT